MMNTRTSTLFVVLTTLTASVALPSFAASPELPARGYRVRSIEHYNTPIVERETTESTVRRLLGEPTRKLDGVTWVYPRFRAIPEQRANDDCTTLIITFSEGRVADMKLVNERAEKVIAANLKPKSTDNTAIASK